MTIQEQAFENLSDAISEGNTESSVNFLFSTLPLHKVQDVVKLLIDSYKNQPELLQQFWNSKSDMCPLEATEHEDQINKFKGFVLSKTM